MIVFNLCMFVCMICVYALCMFGVCCLYAVCMLLYDACMICLMCI